ncbi:glycosyltransferase [Candidatus Halobeggiatoa sp. HSG11]|nr:glycosyltransferase [Candidatus Halobeggiatoa sp. HSG11]
MNNYKEQLSQAQIEIAEQKKEIADLQQTLNERTQDINKLIQWTQSLQQDILAVYNSATWQIGNLIAQIILKLLGRSGGITARDHINKILDSFEAWKINYFQRRQHSTQQPYTPWHDTREYALWIKQFDSLSKIELEQMQKTKLQYRPTISILMPITGDGNCINSILEQIYPNWELLLIHSENLSTTLPVDKRIKKVTENEALNLATGDLIAILDSEDKLPAHALHLIAVTFNKHPYANLIYSDEDKLNSEGKRYDPYLKSDWNPDLFYSKNFINNLAVYRKSIINYKFENIIPGDYEFTLRFIEQIDSNTIIHIPHILYHNKNEKSSTNNCQILQAHFQRLQQPDIKVEEAIGGHTRVIYPLPIKPPLVSLIIPTRDKLKLLRGTIEGILQQTDYKNVEIIIMDNGSKKTETLKYFAQIQQDERITVIQHNAPFNYSQLNNIGVSHANGELIGLINNDLEVINSGWLTEMVSHAVRPEIGAVGAKLYYANDTIQHAGVIVGLGGMAGHNFKFLAREAPGYHWHPFLIQNYSVVTAACLILRREVFEAVEGLNEIHLKVAFNDVDLCLKIREHGYRILWTPYAELYHLESASRGSDNTLKKYLRLRHELNYMQSNWGDVLANDPYYNPNLTIEYEDFALAYPPRI